MKQERQAAILRIIHERPVHTQEELAEALREHGFDVTQATVSRDIRELRLAKVAMAGGAYRYAQPADPGGREDPWERAATAFREYVQRIEPIGALVVIQATAGSAPVVAAALDALSLSEVAATVAGDDVVLVVCRGAGPPTPEAAHVARSLLALADRSAGEKGGGKPTR